MALGASETLSLEVTITGLSKFMAEMESINKAIERTGKKWDGLSGIGGTALGNLQKIGVASLAAIGSAATTATAILGAFVYKGVEAASQMQKLSIGLETLAARELVASGRFENIGEAMSEAVPRAEELMARLRDISLLSPYEYNQVAETLRFNMAMGATADTAMDLTESILNVSAGLGLGNAEISRLNYNLAQALMQGDLTSANLRQLSLVGIDLAGILESELGVSIDTIRKNLENGKLTAEDVSRAFMSYADKNFGGASERMSKSFTGLKSSISDLFFFAGADLLGPALERVTGLLSDAFDKAREWAESGVFKRVGEQIGEIVGHIITFIERVSGGQEPVQALQQLISKLFTPELAEQINHTIRGISDFITKAREVVEPIIAWIAQNTQLSDLLVALGVAIATVIIPMLGSLVASIAPIIATFIAVVAIVAAVRQAWENDFLGMRTALTNFWENTAKPALEKLWEWLKINVPVAIKTLADFWTSTLWPAMQNIWQWIETYAIPWLITLADMIKRFPETLQAWAYSWEMLKEIVATVLDNVKTFITDTIDTWKYNLDMIKEIAKQALDKIKLIVEDAVDRIKNVFTIDWASVGRSIVDGIANGLRNGINIIREAATNAAKSALDAAKSTLGIHSPSAAFQWVGEQAMAGYTQGILRSVPAVRSAIITATAPPGNVINVSNTYNYNLTTNSVVRPGALALEFTAMSLGSR